MDDWWHYLPRPPGNPRIDSKDVLPPFELWILHMEVGRSCQKIGCGIRIYPCTSSQWNEKTNKQKMWLFILAALSKLQVFESDKNVITVTYFSNSFLRITTAKSCALSNPIYRPIATKDLARSRTLVSFPKPYSRTRYGITDTEVITVHT